MQHDNTTTEMDFDDKSQQYLRNLRGENHDSAPDLTVDGMSESILSRLIGLFSKGR